MTSLSRRFLLRGAGVALSLPLLSAMLPRSASAQQNLLRPRRLIWVFQPSGTLMEHWPTPGPLTTLSDMFSPLAPHASRMAVLRNLQDGVRGLEVPGLGPHDAGAVHMLTGAPTWTTALRPPTVADLEGTDILRNGTASQASLDQALAMQATYAALRVPSLQVGHSVAYYDGRPLVSYLSYRGPNQKLASENSTLAVYNRLFGSALPATQPQTDPRAGLITNAVAEEYRALRSGLSGVDRTRLEQHLAELDALRASVAQTAPAVQCAAPANPSNADASTTYSASEAAWWAKTRAQIDNVVLGLVCDLTRVVTFQWGSCMGSSSFGWLSPDLPESVRGRSFHDAGHQVGAVPGETSYCSGVQCGAGAGDAREHFRRIQKLHFQATAYLLDRLLASTNPDGSTLLDDTVVIWSSELARGATHEMTRKGFLLMGNHGGIYRSGVCVDGGNASHTRLLTSIAGSMGLKDSSGNVVTQFGSNALPAAERQPLLVAHR